MLPRLACSLRSTRISTASILRSSRMTDFVPPPMAAGPSTSSSAPKVDASSVPSSLTNHTKITTHNQYHSDGIDFNSLSPSPLTLFQQCFDQANSGGKVKEPEAMLLCTCSSQSPPRPSSRVVLLKSIHPKEGLTFYSNYTSRKAKEMESNPYVSTTFYWRETHQSVRFLGKVRKVEKEESQAYFNSRPVGSRIGAWASPQSQSIQSREELEEMVRKREEEFKVPGAAGLTGDEEAIKKYESTEILVPDHWGGYRIEPTEVEFWCGRENRLHDRFRYTREETSGKLPGEDQWKIERLAP